MHGIRKVRLTVPGRILRVRMGAACFVRATTDGDWVRCGKPNAVPSEWTAGERDRVNASLSRFLVGLLLLEPPDPDGEDSFVP